MFDAEAARAFQEPVHRRAVEVAGPSLAVSLREAGEQLQIHLAREPAEGAVADAVARGVPHARLEVVRDQAEHLVPGVVAVQRMDVEPVEKGRGGRHAHFLVVQ